MKISDCSAQEVRIQLSGVLYSKEVVFKAAYWLTKRCQVSIDWNEASAAYDVSILPKEDPFGEAELSSLVERFNADLVDFTTRQLIAQETKDVRAMLLAKAFANGNDFDAQPVTSA